MLGIGKTRRCWSFRPGCSTLIALLALVLTLIAFHQVYRGFSNNSDSHIILQRLPPPTDNVNSKVLLMHSFPWYYELKPGSHHFRGCPEKRCTMTLDSASIGQADGVVFFSRATVRKPQRYMDQVWVYFAVESPVHTSEAEYERPEWNYQINWTMTYRYDSDIQFGYGHIHPRTEELKPSEQKDYVAIAKKKSKNVAWFVSNCHVQSNRERFVEELKKHIPVDIYGQCGTLKCGRNQEMKCLDMLERDYRFYLSFENSLCKDYITEKLFQKLKYDVLPIVRGGADYKTIIPVKGIINVWDYGSAAELAKYLFHLAENPEEYAKYFEWKNKFYVEEPQEMPLCELCQRLHNPEKWPNVYQNAQKWWKEGACFEPKDV